MTETSDRPVMAGTGVGLRLPHIAEVVSARPDAAWFEIHPENFLANPHALELLEEIARRYPISVHTVGVSIGSASGIDHEHLRRIRQLVDRVEPALISGHLAWSTHEGEYLNDLLPLPYTEETLALISRQFDEVQNGLGRPYLVENPSSYVGLSSSTMSETDFLSALVNRTGCRLLCDVSNIYLSGHNMGFDPFAYIDSLPRDAIGEMHLGGFAAEEEYEGANAQVLVDTHGDRIADPVWDLYAHAVRRFGWQPTLIEWDNDIPPLATIFAEADKATRVASNAIAGARRHAVTR